jgi:mitochondrial fission protein ELM1
LKRPEVKTIWIVSEGSPGHISQSEGLVAALSEKVPVQEITVRGRATVRGWLRPLIRWTMGPKGRPLPGWLLSRIADVQVPADAAAPDLIVSSGGKSVFAARTFARRYDVPYVFIGERKPYPAEWFHTIISPVPGESCANSMDVELIPTPVSPQMIAKKGAVEPGTWCMIIGGASRSHRFCEKDWVNLAAGMNALAQREGIRWLLTTSRRTGAAAEAVLKKRLNPAVLKDAIWWADAPRKELYSFMARAEVLFVTQDSVTMVTEAVSAGKPVAAVFPEKTAIPADSFMNSYLDRLQANGRLLRFSSSDMKKQDAAFDRLNLLASGGVERIAEKLLKRLL